MNRIKMNRKKMNRNWIEQEKIDISEGIDVNKTNLSKECDICHYWCFKHISFEYEPYVCNGCHDLMQKGMGFNNIAIAYVKEVLTEFIFGI